MSIGYKNRKKAIKRGDWKFNPDNQPKYSPNITLQKDTPIRWLVNHVRTKFGKDPTEARFALGVPNKNDLAIKRRFDAEVKRRMELGLLT